ncbi:hypothetical protein Tco_0349342 [Tanacetum coccineum]
MVGALPSDTVKNPKLNINSTTLVLSDRSYPTEDPQCSTHIHGSINTVTIHPKQQRDSHVDEPAESEEEEKDSPENTNTNPSASPDPSISFITEKDICSIIDPRLSQVVLGKPFVDISNMTHDPPEGVVRFTNGTDEVAYKMPHKIE